MLRTLQEQGMKGYDISDDEMSKSHARYMIGGCQVVSDERVFRFGKLLLHMPLLMPLVIQFEIFQEFPERPGALRKFLVGLHKGWNISLFHYRNHGAGTPIIYH